MIRRLMRLAVFAGPLIAAMPAFAQNSWETPGGSRVDGKIDMCLNAQGKAVPVDQSGACPSGGGSSSTPFTPNGNFGTLTATAASSGSTALPAGTVVAFQNTSTIDVSCVLSAGVATATTNKIVVRAGSTVFVAVGANVNAACINQTGAASNVVVLAGGSGLGTNFGGSTAGGSGGAVFGPTANGAAAANPPVLVGGTANGTATGNVGNWKVDSAGTGFIDCISGGTLCTALANGVQTAGSAVGTQLIAWGINVAGNARQPTGSNPSGSIYAMQTDIVAVGGATATAANPLPVGPSPYPVGAVPYTNSATGTTTGAVATLAGAASVTTYICGFSVRANATAATTVNMVVSGTISGSLNFTQWVAPLASGIGIAEMIFNPCVPASAANTSIVVTGGAPGAGGVNSATAWGYKL